MAWPSQARGANWHGTDTSAPRQTARASSEGQASRPSDDDARLRLATSASGLGSSLPHMPQDWARRCHSRTGTGPGLPPPATSALGLGSPGRTRTCASCCSAAARSAAASASSSASRARSFAARASDSAAAVSAASTAALRLGSVTAALLQRPSTKASESTRLAVGGGTRLHAMVSAAQETGEGALTRAWRPRSRALHAPALRGRCRVHPAGGAAPALPTGTETAKSDRHVMETHETHRPAAATVDGRSMDGRWTDGRDGRRGEEA